MQNQEIIEKSPASGLAIASCILATLSLLIGPFGCIPAIVCGHIARKQDKTQVLALVGLIIGYVLLSLMIIIALMVSLLTVK